MAVREVLDRLGGSRASLADKCRELAAVLAEVTERLVAAVKEQLAASPPRWLGPCCASVCSQGFWVCLALALSASY